MHIPIDLGHTKESTGIQLSSRALAKRAQSPGFDLWQKKKKDWLSFQIWTFLLLFRTRNEVILPSEEAEVLHKEKEKVWVKLRIPAPPLQV